MLPASSMRTKVLHCERDGALTSRKPKWKTAAVMVKAALMGVVKGSTTIESGNSGMDRRTDTSRVGPFIGLETGDPSKEGEDIVCSYMKV